MFPEKKQQKDPTGGCSTDELLLLIAINAAILAGEAIMRIYRSGFEIDFKEDLSPLTTADTAAHRIISEALELTGLPEISEEGSIPPYEERCTWKRYWLVDPLDGTKEFISKNGEFTVNIALIENEKPLLGVVYAPVPEELFFACPSAGAWKTTINAGNYEHPGNLKDLTSVSQSLPQKAFRKEFIAVCSRRHSNQQTLDFIESFPKSSGEITYLSRGSSLKFCAIAEGCADLYPRFAPTMEWDSGAGQAIAEISGAQVLNADTMQPLTYNKPDLHNPSFIVSRI